jgi:uncharacterized membrane protein YhaH (DUF805 family)
MSLSLFTTFQGRINRKQFWIGFLIVGIMRYLGYAYFDPQLFDASPPAHTSLSDTLWSLFLLIPATAIAVKRFNDRDWPWWLGYLAGATWLIGSVGPYFGLFINPNTGTANAVAFWLLAVSAAAATIDNGFMRGTAGPNRYGAAPQGPVPVIFLALAAAVSTGQPKQTSACSSATGSTT